MGEPIALSWSGGKDSSLALAALRADPRWEVVALLTSITAGYDRVSIHGVRRVLLDAQVRRLGLPLVEITLAAQSSNEAYEAAFAHAVDALRAELGDVPAVAFGDLFLEDVRAYRERLASTLAVRPVFPLWGLPTTELAARFVADGYEAYLTCVDTTQLAASFVGRRFDTALLAELPASVDPCGERGEFHTFVAAGPIFADPTPVTRGEVVLRDGRFAYCDLLPG